MHWGFAGAAQALHAGAVVIPLWPHALGALFALGVQRREGVGGRGGHLPRQVCTRNSQVRPRPFAPVLLRFRRGRIPFGALFPLGSQRRGGLGGGLYHALDSTQAGPPRDSNALALAQLPAGR